MAAEAAEHPRTSREAARRFDPPNFLLYFGAGVALAATVLMGDSFDRYRSWVAFVVSLVYLAAFAAGSAALLRRGWAVAGGLLATLAVATVPWVVYAFEKWAGWWPRDAPTSYGAFHQEILASWIAMELVTIAVGLVVLYLVGFPLILAPIAFVAWYLSMDVAPALFGQDVSPDERAAVSLVVAAVLIAFGVGVDVRGFRRHAFWLHFFGLLIALGSLCWLTFAHDDNLTWALITLVSAATIFAAIPLGRATYAVFGAIGLVTTMYHWAGEVFDDSIVFAGALTVVGLAFVALGLVWRAQGDRWARATRARLSRLRAGT